MVVCLLISVLYCPVFR